MDGVFGLPVATRTDFLRSLVQSFGCTYVCLWQFNSNLSNRLFFLDGFYDVTNNQPSSSLWSELAKWLFQQYHALTFDVNDDWVPGVAFRNHLPYIELQLLDLIRLTSTEIQTQFYQEAKIEVLSWWKIAGNPSSIAVFMGCKNGEIELGFSKNMSQVIKQTTNVHADIQTALNNLFPQNLYINYHSTDHKQPSSSSMGNPDQFSSVIPSYFPTPEGEHEAIVRALIHVILSPSCSTSEKHQVPHQNFPKSASLIHPGDTVFKRHRSDIMREPNIIQEANPISTQQYYHTISERRRREKLTESFQALRALLPPETKTNKASILTAAKETMRSLMDEIEKLNMRSRQLMTVLSVKEAEENKARSSNESFNVRVSHVSESSSSEEQMVNLQVIVRGESCQVDILIHLLKFLEGIQNVNLISMAENNNHTTGGTPINQFTFRLSIIEGSEWDERAFQEAVRRVVMHLDQ